jgi:hypothetical protein
VSVITGDLIRIKNMVDDCLRLARSIEREAERLTPEERTHLTEHISGNTAQIQYLVGLLAKADGKPPVASPSVTSQ